MAEADVDRAREAYGRLIDHDRVEFDDFLDVEPEDRADEVSTRLAERFRKPPDAVMIRVRGRHVGVSTLARVREAEGVAGGEIGAGDGASPLGSSTRYRTIQFSCGNNDSTAIRSFYDERQLPTCPNGHGPMELQR
ncbi:hypothetical protein [Actinocrispum wychmicini]|uniref:Uncharacterized protein n=1 Tax=Actinocrispum wychmicini TaxID=1213861 RepID=A0A4R2JLU9_9PSEU|nr:hypothetical protein [Actinocrispum wychmicini]TCO59847.1 hypothetical protein EV192_104690 [Actinocrispum wychmicini]